MTTSMTTYQAILHGQPVTITVIAPDTAYHADYRPMARMPGYAIGEGSRQAPKSHHHSPREEITS